jgi:hypothetical protein
VRQRLVVAARESEHVAVPEAPRGVVGVEFEGVAQVSLGPVPVEVVAEHSEAERGVAFGERGV